MEGKVGSASSFSKLVGKVDKSEKYDSVKKKLNFDT